MFFDCQTMTGCQPSDCPNYKECKKASKHQPQPESNLPYTLGSFLDSDYEYWCLSVKQDISREDIEIGYHPAVKLFYQWTEEEGLTIGKTQAFYMACDIPHDARLMGFEIPELMPYGLAIMSDRSVVVRFRDAMPFPQAWIDAGFYPATTLPRLQFYTYADGCHEMTVAFDYDDTSYQQTIDDGWIPAEALPYEYFKVGTSDQELVVYLDREAPYNKAKIKAGFYPAEDIYEDQDHLYM